MSKSEAVKRQQSTSKTSKQYLNDNYFIWINNSVLVVTFKAISCQISSVNVN